MDIFEEEKLFPHGQPLPRSKISYSLLLEMVFAAQWAHYRTDEFFELDSQQQAIVIQAYRSKHQIEAVLNQDAQIRAEIEKAASEAERMGRR